MRRKKQEQPHTEEPGTGQLRAEPEDRADRAGSPLAGITGTAEWRAGLGRFLSREKEFLQSMASLIQQHAEGVKDDAQRARDEAASMASQANQSAQPAVTDMASPKETSVEPAEPAEPEPAQAEKAERVIDLTSRQDAEDDRDGVS